MKTDTVQQRRAELAQRMADAHAKLNFEERILSELPETIPAPTISNESEHAFFGHAGAWVTFSRPYYDPENKAPTGVQILAALEAAGYSAIPATLCKWDQYRRAAEPGALHEMPDVKHPKSRMQYKLTDAEAIAPVWLEPNQHTGTEARCYMRSPSGLWLKLSVAGPSALHIHAKRVEHLGGWRFEQGSARLIYPGAWHAINTEAGETVANVNQNSRAYRDTDQGLSGSLFFTPLHEQAEFPLTPSQFLARIEATK